MDIVDALKRSTTSFMPDFDHWEELSLDAQTLLVSLAFNMDAETFLSLRAKIVEEFPESEVEQVMFHEMKDHERERNAVKLPS